MLSEQMVLKDFWHSLFEQQKADDFFGFFPGMMKLLDGMYTVVKIRNKKN